MKKKNKINKKPNVTGIAKKNYIEVSFLKVKKKTEKIIKFHSTRNCCCSVRSREINTKDLSV